MLRDPEALKEGTRQFNNHVSLLPCPCYRTGLVDGSTMLRSFQRGENLLRPLAPLQRDPTRKKEGGRKALVPICRCLTLPLDDLHRGRPHGDGGTGVGQKADIVRKYG